MKNSTKFGTRQCSNCYYFRTWDKTGNNLNPEKNLNAGSCLYYPPQIYHGIRTDFVSSERLLQINLTDTPIKDKNSGFAKSIKKTGTIALPSIRTDSVPSYNPSVEATSVCSKHEWALSDQRKISWHDSSGRIHQEAPSWKGRAINIFRILWRWGRWVILVALHAYLESYLNNI